jgi:hypothetical protein
LQAHKVDCLPTPPKQRLRRLDALKTMPIDSPKVQIIGRLTPQCRQRVPPVFVDAPTNNAFHFARQRVQSPKKS